MFPEPEPFPGMTRPPMAGTEVTPYAFAGSVPQERALVRQPQPHRSRSSAAADSVRPDHIVMSTVVRALGDAVRDGVLLPLCRLLGRLAAATAAGVTQLSRYLRKTRGNVVSQLLDPHVRAVPQARRIIRAELARWGLHEHADTAELLVSELVTNALQHAWGPIRLRMSHSVDGRTLRCDIADGCPATPPAARPPARTDEEHGRGLHLVEQLSTRWGILRTPAGKLIWFELRTPGRARRLRRLRRRILRAPRVRAALAAPQDRPAQGVPPRRREPSVRRLLGRSPMTMHDARSVFGVVHLGHLVIESASSRRGRATRSAPRPERHPAGAGLSALSRRQRRSRAPGACRV
ncbi:ATP-binding protein [Streptomyces lydicamycinicus]|uniref:ATP-binding protein n=2 Tax=Streptomyces lydicamycinicus TaxID=1546107 RepID=A0A0P4RC64_9ACTN|nr:ATP-binding protein [Streptomyces lydicamycinicus]